MLRASADINTLKGMVGDDTLQGYGGTGNINGGTGIDTKAPESRARGAKGPRGYRGSDNSHPTTSRGELRPSKSNWLGLRNGEIGTLETPHGERKQRDPKALWWL
jgi:hypothetical protein